MSRPVLQQWVQGLPWKMQSVLIAGQRGPDTHHAPGTKALAKWLRSITQENGDPSTGFMEKTDIPGIYQLRDELEFGSLHYALHLAKALEIVAYKHPSHDTPTGLDDPSRKAWYYYYGICLDVFHLNPEKESQLDERLQDKVKS